MFPKPIELTRASEHSLLARHEVNEETACNPYTEQQWIGVDVSYVRWTHSTLYAKITTREANGSRMMISTKCLSLNSYLLSIYTQLYEPSQYLTGNNFLTVNQMTKLRIVLRLK